ncbi:MAG: 50S ribosomal protein L4 [Candidatus Terrybacteria bacterium RIFCSPLOWO2_01_FULL_44_24]|uniref:Large ribosomal subunit protein uL4 n=1 Tax=Candidatus Terrybacteria bacterium RIFCSPHIGHO2_01_FULL_43_35 TaxID=1802361 RepID=A0A1G2PD00_9BACT|nr:MAG: 50S ribosomal protein L4 [Candidatus Terrybacteria bacterium RIFCSPHIGHO2_01_FULL_43_35]OHA49432.1 MAG: 50S ribosomal protein L4 [Candidatus Terrybacteria bacterium RIFCSPHIGHO2_02_FULL_43_14]OHA51659.1 MAG: 50S ribosomal protein L4 [Candidatus Terrybacteria bacterium RIFCSPLOWO2_01_FULL_44_24]
MKVNLYTQEGKQKGHLDLPDDIFDVPMNADLLHQAVRVLRVNKRRVLAHTKTRSEVSGGGKKPWRQKGTGRARQGSIRSPQWRGGGVVFGPSKNKVYRARLPLKMKRKAMRIALSAKARDGEIIAVESLNIPEAKTKHMALIFNNVMSFHVKGAKTANRNAILVLSEKQENILRASRNLSSLQVMPADQLNLLDILSKKFLIVMPDSISVFKKRLG